MSLVRFEPFFVSLTVTMACRILNTCRRDPVDLMPLSVNGVQYCGF